MLIQEVLDNIKLALDDKKAQEVSILKITDLSFIADYFVIATGTSSTHVKALAESVEDKLEKLGKLPNKIEGRATGWILIDYGTVIVHVFTPAQREFYNLEKLWADAEKVD